MKEAKFKVGDLVQYNNANCPADKAVGIVVDLASYSLNNEGCQPDPWIKVLWFDKHGSCFEAKTNLILISKS